MISTTRLVSEGRSDFIRARGLRFHVQRWGDAQAPMIFLLHGWLDVAATFAPLVQELLRATRGRWQVLAPDARGFGASEWPAEGGYWFPNYLADFESLLDHYAPTAAPTLIGHSMGGQIASLYAGLRPARVHQLVVLDSLFLPDMAPNDAPRRIRCWLDEVRQPLPDKHYASFEELAQRVLRVHPQLTPDRALFVARCWGREDGRGRIGLRADPVHRINGPSLYRSAEAEAVWADVTAPTLFLDAADSQFRRAITSEETVRRRACFRTRKEAVVPDCGHMMHFDAPEATARAIAAELIDPPAGAAA